MRKIFAIVSLLLFTVSCEEKPPTPVAPIELSGSGSNGDIDVPAHESLGNVQFRFMVKTVLGGSVAIWNGNARSVGVNISSYPDSSITYFSDGYTPKGKPNMSAGVGLPKPGSTVVVKIFTWNSVGEGFKDFFSIWGKDFLKNIEETWFDNEFRRLVVLPENTPMPNERTAVIDDGLFLRVVIVPKE